jgi:hypothetical protein
MPLESKAIVKQIDEALSVASQGRSLSRYDDLSDLGDAKLSEILVVLADTIQRFAPPGSTFREKAELVAKEHGMGSQPFQIKLFKGILEALRRAYDSDYLKSVQELVHADVFSDFIEMAAYLLSEGYKDPAAVIVGSILEEHLRNICAKNGIATTDAGGKAKKASTLNDELAKASVYGKLEQKNVTAWLDLRNRAAHGQYTQFDKNHVEHFIQGVREFLVRIPA